MALIKQKSVYGIETKRFGRFNLKNHSDIQIPEIHINYSHGSNRKNK